MGELALRDWSPGEIESYTNVKKKTMKADAIVGCFPCLLCGYRLMLQIMYENVRYMVQMEFMHYYYYNMRLSVC